ncbi:MAG: ATP-dependent RNA helicase [uncultured Chloroflexia bacterium]|uniref:ATP-dependent RNA helicase n=1 Tax=uncultured Chloroflexia bacterium TaxID=1672391 RepID=A0A6J4IVG9_9CHLR|nr:MAG: ATP-dependent RNA helicase [uncultured Chloroflexia bacterium]
MEFSQALRDLRNDPEHQERIVHVHEQLPQAACFGDLEPPLAPAIQQALAVEGITRLYSHQAQAVTVARRGEHVGVVTATASGKTLCYHLPTLEAVLADPRQRALYLFPTKALAQDQLRSLEALAKHLPHLRPSIYDGDTPQAERAAIRAGSNILLSNPDMLHVGILPNHERWRRMLQHLRIVVIDEAHIYRGVFGSHVAQLLRRLRRLCEHYGSQPQFVLASATIGNAQEHLEALIGDKVTIIDNNGSPRGPRTLMFWNPPLVSVASGTRRSANVETTKLFTDLVASEVRTLAFTKARKIAELLLRYARARLAEQGANNATRIASYRAGYTPEDRREIEHRLWSGKLWGVVSTNALELGVDIGGLDVAILNGYPGTVASTWQQWGRAGRSQAPSAGILVALDDPMDQYWMRHPEEFFGRPHEHARIALANPYILADHLLCAAFERPLEADETEHWFGNPALTVVDDLVAHGELSIRGDRAFVPGTRYPAQEVSIRATGGEVVELRTEDGQLIERVPLNRVPFEIHTGAIYLHQGESFLVLNLDLVTGTAIARQADVSYYTQARDSTDIRIGRVTAQRQAGTTTVRFGEVDVRRTVVGYRRKALYREDVLSDHDLELPPQEFMTQAVWWTLPMDEVNKLRSERADVPGGLHGAEHAMIALLPLLTMCDRWDIGGLSTVWHPDTAEATVFVYDGVPGGVGISEEGYHRIEEWWGITAQLLAECPCEDGCPSCVQSPKCGSGNDPLDKAVALRILRKLIGPPTTDYRPPTTDD